MEIIDQFKAYLTQLGYGTTTVYMLPICVAEFINRHQKPFNEIEASDIAAYHDYIKQRPNKRGYGALSESYIRHHLYALKVFFTYLLENEQIERHPVQAYLSSFKLSKPRSKAREILTKTEIELLYQATMNYKEKAVLSLFYGCGLRRSEAAQLRISDLHFNSRLLYVRSGKGGKRRAVPMSKKVQHHFEKYIEIERVQALKNTKEMVNQKAFILNQNGHPMSGSSYARLLKEILARTNIKKHITLHCLRHSIASHLLESGLSLEYVRDFLGHKHLESTQIYTRIKNKQLWSINMKTNQNMKP